MIKHLEMVADKSGFVCKPKQLRLAYLLQHTYANAKIYTRSL